jgi:uncharacterized protein (DUF2235 family)
MKRRLIVCLDGTGQHSIRDKTQITNVTRFARCVKTSTKDAIQLVYYREGCGVQRESDLPGNVASKLDLLHGLTAGVNAVTGQGRQSLETHRTCLLQVDFI